MFVKLLSVFVTIAIVSGQHQQPARFPAGVNPALCPDFPNCDNARLHSPNANQYNPQPQYYQPQYQAPAPSPYYSNGPVNNHLPGAGGDKYPAGVDPQSCPNYPFCDNLGAPSAPRVAPLPGWNERLYPAGVSPNECPNFPYCH